MTYFLQILQSLIIQAFFNITNLARLLQQIYEDNKVKAI